MQFDSTRCRVVAEVAQAHDGSLGTAHAYIDAIAKTGADAVKFQTHIAAAESTPGEPWRVRFSYQDETRYGYWKRMEFTEPQWLGLRKHAEEKDLEFLSSPFSLEAARMLMRIGIRTWKVASGEISNRPLFDYLLETRLPIIISTGMSSLAETDAAVGRLKASGVPFAVTQCTSAYPCPPEKVGLNMLSYYRDRYQCAIGLSDHSGTIFPGLAAATLGAELLELHVVFSRECFGPDVVASVTTPELATLVEGIRYIEKMRIHAVDKNQMAVELAPVRQLFTKSIVITQDMPSGAVLVIENLAFKKPGTGLPAERLPFVLGRRLRRAVLAGEMLQESDLAEETV